MAETTALNPHKERSLRIMEVATQLFHEQGYEAVSLRDIAKRAGISSGSLYYYIESKQSLLVDLMEESLSALLHAVTSAGIARVHPSKQLALLTNVFLEQARRDGLQLALAFRESGRLSTHHRGEIDGLLLRFTDQLDQAISARCGVDCSYLQHMGITGGILSVLKSHLYDEPWLVGSDDGNLLCRIVDVLATELVCTRGKTGVPGVVSDV
ncbi:TetR/AcrR family transcriptional regulator [Pseudomonas sp. v388]|uniref:TetR/AcrR family transcriptional regulator n=1 Tax=Pseudomonas sp. v388 TaxID=2479849 RepID=UPI000F7B3B4D|nr:TetR/AcrR family transcriptional regulator [Pseudomonas sp. v388]RRV10473.1 TetR/AcrR family transcriptional regulator [Pseudomonas sp. v388]